MALREGPYYLDPRTRALPLAAVNTRRLAIRTRLMALEPIRENPVTEESSLQWRPYLSQGVNAKHVSWPVAIRPPFCCTGIRNHQKRRKLPVNGRCLHSTRSMRHLQRRTRRCATGERSVDAVHPRGAYDGDEFQLRQRMSHRFQWSDNYTLAGLTPLTEGAVPTAIPRLSTQSPCQYEWGPSPTIERNHVT